MELLDEYHKEQKMAAAAAAGHAYIRINHQHFFFVLLFSSFHFIYGCLVEAFCPEENH